MIYADASFIVALFARGDDHWEAAWRWWKTNHTQTLVVSRLTIFEAENTIRALATGGKCRPAESLAAVEGIRRAIVEGLLVRRSVPEHRLFPAGTRLSLHHTTQSAFGALDILHVATALELKADVLVSFDTRQRELAQAEGLKAVP